MAKREIRISFFYTDQSVLDFTRLKRRLDEMVKSANDFFGKYKLRLDTFPFPYNYLAYKDAFVLREYDGIEPDVGMDLLKKHMDEDTARDKVLDAEEDDPNTSAARRVELRALRKALNAQVQARVWEGFNSSAEHDVRMALAQRFASNKTLKKYERAWRKAPRLPVVLCKFVSLPQHSLLNQETIGQYTPALSAEKARSYRQFKKRVPTFVQPYVLLDITQANWVALAHEIVHGNGHVHPEGTLGGLYDGPAESIMNYSAYDLTPSKAILEEADQKLLEVAFFVRG
ncbi:hypothetical protein FGE12_25600 [Aggregicoccus sp. 17bor-14]|uniref:hypothetical protein n=1 Tax=Myxococcaceae TaxID=31 RepID=UPI00129CEFE7|nr:MULTISPECIES: hypothetical protein [Myxococcaceae]MBF5045809.1 hypothetical protein [Simulacricoccus sp. 17bor-14]MRI91544.1 hypothetical protein [Aggregicoccus sp. 17bor-14]